MQANGFAINTERDLATAAQALVAVDARFGALHKRNGLPRLRRRAGGLEGLAWIVTGQLISARAAQVIWGRVSAGLAPFEPEVLAAMDEGSVAGLGLTKAKARTIIAAAAAVRDGRFSFEGLDGLDDAEASAVLMQLKGVGRWSADIYLMTCLGRCDAWPAGDLAVRVGLQKLLGLGVVPPVAAMDGLAEAWRPWRSVAARYLWDHYVAGQERGVE